MSNHTYSVVSLLAAGILPPLAMAFLVFYNRRMLKKMDQRIAEMNQISAGMREMLAAPSQIRAAARAIRDTITRVQGEDIAEYPRQNGHSSPIIRPNLPGTQDGNRGLDAE